MGEASERVRSFSSAVRFGFFRATLRRRFGRAGLLFVARRNTAAAATLPGATAHATARGEENQKDCKTILEGTRRPAMGRTNTVRRPFVLFLQEVRDDPVARVKLNSERLLWEELSPVEVDTHKLEHLFESRAKDFITKVNPIVSTRRHVKSLTELI